MDDAADEQARALEDAADEAILTCGGDAREAVKALIVLNEHLEQELSQVSYGYARGRTWLRDAS